MMKLRSFAHTDVGLVRPENEDSFLRNDIHRLYAVADGIGGLPSGAQASQLAVATLEKIFTSHGAGHKLNYPRILAEVNDQVFRLGRVLSPQFGIGSTLTFAHVTGVKLNIGHVGDSSAFRLRSKHLEQLTRDHTIETEMQDRAARGEPMALLMENRNALTRCIGQPPPLEAECASHTLLPHDRYLLCSDGISRFVNVVEIADILGTATEPEAAARQLVQRANERGGLDNSTAVVLFFD
ncbi:MAG: serine/threonine-protein phosphatase [Opitutae bacterium]|nr:serine/threonine-protein phosphatase [Opitutae bacterium]